MVIYEKGPNKLIKYFVNILFQSKKNYTKTIEWSPISLNHFTELYKCYLYNYINSLEIGKYAIDLNAHLNIWKIGTKLLKGEFLECEN